MLLLLAVRGTRQKDKWSHTPFKVKLKTNSSVSGACSLYVSRDLLAGVVLVLTFVFALYAQSAYGCRYCPHAHARSCSGCWCFILLPGGHDKNTTMLCFLKDDLLQAAPKELN